jgi:hypothetical protein
MEGLCGSEIFQRGLCVQAFYPPGGTPRLYGRQDARRYRKAAEGRRSPGRWRECRWLMNHAQRLGLRQSSGALGADGAHFRLDIAAQALK